MTSFEIRVLAPAGIEDYHAHLLRLDRGGRHLRYAAESDDQGIDGHCLRLLGAQAIVIGGYVDGTLRAAIEICPDRTARRAEAVFTAESKYSLDTGRRMPLTRMLDEARRYHLAELALYGLEDRAELARVAQPSGIQVAGEAPAILRFESAFAPPPRGAAHASQAARYG